MHLKLAAPLALVMVLAACATPSPALRPQPAPAGQPSSRPVPPMEPAPPPVAGFRMPEIMRGPGMEGVIREGPNSLMRQFGQPRLDVVEGDMRKLQFAATACVLDVYLYPLHPGGDPQATWLEARRASDGAAVDLLACMQAMRQARGRHGGGTEGARE